MSQIILPEGSKGGLLDRTKDWVWYQGTDGSDVPTPGQTFLRSRAYINDFLQALAQSGIPFERIYCPVTFTINIVFPDEILKLPGVEEMFKDGGYKRKVIPEKTDAQTSKELRDAIMAGAQIAKTWH